MPLKWNKKAVKKNMCYQEGFEEGSCWLCVGKERRYGCECMHAIEEESREARWLRKSIMYCLFISAWEWDNGGIGEGKRGCPSAVCVKEKWRRK
jgi:hypothetical protein